MLELLFVIGFLSCCWSPAYRCWGLSRQSWWRRRLMFVGGLFALMIKLLPWLLLAVAVVWIIRVLKSPNGNAFRDNNRWRY